MADPRVKMSMFMSGVSTLVIQECRTAVLNKEMDLAGLITYAAQIEEHKLKDMARDNKRASVNGGVL